MRSLFQFWLSHRAELAGLVAQHVLIVAISTMFGPSARIAPQDQLVWYRMKSMLAASATMGSRTTTICPSVDAPRGVISRTSRMPGRASG